MSTQQDIYVAGSENRLPMLHKDNYLSQLMSRQMMNSLTKKVKQMEADDQAIQTILMGLLEDIYAVVDSCDTAQEIWLRVEQMMKAGSGDGIVRVDVPVRRAESKYSVEQVGVTIVQEKKAKLFNEWERNKHFPEKIASNLKFLNNLQPEWQRYVTTVHQTKDMHEVDYIQLYDFLKFNQTKVNEIKAERLARTHDPLALMIAQSAINIGQERQIQLVGGNDRNQFGQYAGNQNRLIVVLWIANQNANQTGNGNVVVARAGGNGNGKNGDIDEIEEVNANCILMANLQQASTSGTQTDKALVYDSNGSAKNDSNVISMDSSMEHIEKVNTVNRKMKEKNANLTTQLARYRGQEKSFENNKSKFDELETGYRKSVYKKQCLTKRINALHLSSAKLITALNEEIANLKAAKFVRDFKSLAKEANESLDKITVLEKEKECLLRVVASQDIISIVQSPTVVETSALQTDLERKEEMFENSQLGDLKGKSLNTQCALDTIDPSSQNLEDKNVSLKF
ncbi:retrovirus-related pol polyprotein from transposon TNT 1-94 [Tanacetum coccineum]